MKRNTAIAWTVLSTFLCGWPGMCLLSLGISSLITQPEFRSANSVFALGSLILLAFPIIVSFSSFRSSINSGITGLALMLALSGLLQIGAAFFFILAAGAATNTTGIGEAIVAFAVSGLFLVGTSSVIWFIHIRKSGEVVIKEPSASVAYRSISAENDPGYTKSTKIMLAILAIVIVITIITTVMNNL